MKPTGLSWLSFLTAAGLAGAGLSILANASLRGALVPAAFLFAGIPLATAVLSVVLGGRMPLLAAVVAAIYLWEGLQGAPTTGGPRVEPTETLYLWLGGLRVLQAAFSAVATFAAVGEAIRRIWPANRPAVG